MLHICLFYILIYQHLSQNIDAEKRLLSGAEYNLINIGSVVVFSYKGHGWDGYAGWCDQSVAHPDASALAQRGDEEEQEEDHPNQVVHHGEEAGQRALIDRIGQLHLEELPLVSEINSQSLEEALAGCTLIFKLESCW